MCTRGTQLSIYILYIVKTAVTLCAVLRTACAVEEHISAVVDCAVQGDFDSTGKGDSSSSEKKKEE